MLEDTPKHMAHLAILLRVSHFTTTFLSDIDIHSLASSHEHEACKKFLSTFYVTPSKFANLSLVAKALSGHALNLSLFGRQSISEIYFNRLQAFFDIYCPFVEFSSLPSLTRSFSPLLPPTRELFSMIMA